MPRLLIVVVGLALAAAGLTEGADAIVQWVFGIVDGIAYTDVWRPLYNPEPMDTYAYRPLSVLLLKLGLLVCDRSVLAMSATHGVVLVFFGLAAFGFLRRHGFGAHVSALASVSALAMPSLLFSAWICVEFDLVGATFVLAAANALRDHEDEPGRRAPLWRFWLFAAFAVTIKETSALQLLAYLGAFAWLRRSDPRWWRLTAAYLAALVVCTLPMHFVDSGNTHAFTLWSDGFHPIRVPAMLLHTGAQLVFVASAAGVVLLVAAALRTAPRLPRVALVLALAVALYAAAPVLRHYSHFEAVVFSSGPWTIACFLLLAGSVAALLRPGAGLSKLERTALAMLTLTWLGYAAAPIVLRFARADVSARIFAACVPLIHALAWRELGALLRAERLPLRAAGALAGASFALFVLSSAFNTVVFHRTRLAVETEAKARLVADLRMPCPALVATNPVQLLTVEELRAQGAALAECAWVETTSGQPDASMTIDTFADSGGVTADPGQDVYLFVQTARARMSAGANVALAGDFGWTRHLLPESDDDLFAGYQRMIYEIETDIETLFARDGRRVARVHDRFYQLPLWWNEAPARLIRGVPLVESYDYVGSVYRIPARRPGWVPPGGRGRRDRGADRDRR